MPGTGTAAGSGCPRARPGTLCSMAAPSPTITPLCGGISAVNHLGLGDTVVADQHATGEVDLRIAGPTPRCSSRSRDVGRSAGRRSTSCRTKASTGHCGPAIRRSTSHFAGLSATTCPQVQGGCTRVIPRHSARDCRRRCCHRITRSPAAPWTARSRRRTRTRHLSGGRVARDRRVLDPDLGRAHGGRHRCHVVVGDRRF